MRKLVVSTLTSLDGFSEGPGNDLMSLPFDDGFSAYNLQLLLRSSTQLFGRRFFDGFHDYWAGVAEDDAQPAVEREIAGINLGIEKVVISDTLRPDPDASWSETTRIVRRADAAAAVAALKQQGGDDIVMFGSPTTWSPLAEQGLVDEVHVLVGPALLGGGTNVYGGTKRLALELLETRQLPDSRLVLLRYAAATT
jgi:dihydrofolate reductase